MFDLFVPSAIIEWCMPVSRSTNKKKREEYRACRSTDEIYIPFRCKFKIQIDNCLLYRSKWVRFDSAGTTGWQSAHTKKNAKKFILLSVCRLLINLFIGFGPEEPFRLVHEQQVNKLPVFTVHKSQRDVFFSAAMAAAATATRVRSFDVRWEWMPANGRTIHPKSQPHSYIYPILTLIHIIQQAICIIRSQLKNFLDILRCDPNKITCIWMSVRREQSVVGWKRVLGSETTIGKLKKKILFIRWATDGRMIYRSSSPAIWTVSTMSRWK